MNDFKLCNVRKIVSTTHHYGYLNHNIDKKFGFVRISKSGSTSFTSCEKLGLNSYFKIKDYKNDIYAALRNPHARFLSSIPETLSRIKCCSENMKFPDRMNLNVSNDIVDLIENNNDKSPSEVFYLFIDIIKNYGFFDAHHEPQYFFLTNINSTCLNNIKIFNLNQSNEAAQEIYNKHFDSRKYNLPKSNSGLERTVPKMSFLKKIKQNKREALTNPYKNPMYRWGIKRKIPVEKIRPEFYRELKLKCSSSEARKELKKIYQIDYHLISQIGDKNIFHELIRNKSIT